MNEFAINWENEFKICIFHILERSYITQLLPKLRLHHKVKNVKIRSPLSVIRLIRGIQFLPGAKHCLIRQIHLSVNIAINIAIECDALRIGRVHDWQRITIKVKVCIAQICIIIKFFVDKWSKLLEFRLGISVNYVHHVGAVVEVLILIDANVIVSFICPSILICLGQLCARLRLWPNYLCHSLWWQRSGNDEHDT